MFVLVMPRHLCNALVAVFFSISTAHSAELVGTIPGVFDVTPTGAATYTIPIDAPAGTGGMRPSIALMYNHRGGTGIAGQGWTLTGVSRISRCPKTLADDGEIAGVEYTLDDRFCLDGNRLIGISGTYGESGSEYRTQIETFKKIVASGTQGNGPSSFTVTDPNGTMHTYTGYLTNSATSSYRFWARSATEDRFGNKIVYTYDVNQTSGEFLLDLVWWTSNTGESLTPKYRIAFDYEERPATDKRIGYMFGSLNSRYQRLKTVDVQRASSGWNSINEYTLSYSTGDSGRSQLDSIERCSGTDCFPKTDFVWQDATVSWNNETSTGQSSAGHTNAKRGDFNGDGQQDLVVVVSSELHILPASNGGFGAPIDTNKASLAVSMVLDFNGDGMDDLLGRGSDGDWHIYESTGTGFTDIDTGEIATCDDGYCFAQDVDGDGRDDLLYLDGTKVYLQLSTGTDLSATRTEVLSHNDMVRFVGSAEYAVNHQIDFNGDGRGDIIRFNLRRIFVGQAEEEEAYTDIKVDAYVFNGTDYSYYGDITDIYERDDDAGIESDYVREILADFNGDGLTDVFYVTDSSENYRLSSGSTLLSELSPSPPYSNWKKMVIGDYNADGRSDIVVPQSNGWVACTYSHTYAHGFLSSQCTNIGGTSPTTTPVIPMDVTGDGFNDLVLSTSNSWKIRAHKTPLPDVVTKFTDGLGNYVEPIYDSIATSNHYTQESSGSPPDDQSYQVPLHVVTDYKRNDGVGGSYTNTVFYYGAKRSLKGRGFLGFNQVREYDTRGAGWRLSRKYFHQSFPYIGRLDFELVRVDANSNERAKTDVAWANSNTHTGVYFVRPSKTVRWTYEIGGTHHGDIVTRIDDDPIYDTTYGGVTKRVIKTTSDFAVGDTYKTTIDYTLSNDTTNWCLGLPTAITVTKEAPGATTKSRSTSNVFSTSDCSLSNSTDTSLVGTENQLKTTYTYDDFGNVKTVSLNSADGLGDERKTEFFYDSNSHLVESVKNYIDSLTDPEVEYTWDYDIVRPLTFEDARGQTTTWTYDAFGRQATETRPDGTSVTTSYTECSSPCTFSNGEYFVKNLESVGLEQRTYFDSLGRPVGGWHHLPGGDKSNFRFVYDQQGRVEKRYIPWVDGESSYFVDLDYDLLSRLVKEDAPISETYTSGSITEISYEDLTYTVTNAEDQDTKYEFDPIGRLVSVIDDPDSLAYETEYEYTSFDQLHKTWDPADNLTTITYNDRGDKESMIVPGMLSSTCSSTRTSSASMSFGYNVFGEVTSQLDAACQETTYAYNQLGLMTSRVDDDGGSNEGTTSWTYFTTADHKLWLPSTISSPGSITEAITYDTLSRIEDIKTTIDSTTYEIDFEYHTTGSGKGQLKTLTYPVSTASVRHEVDYEYDSYGHLKQVKDGSLLYYQLHESDAYGRERYVELGEDGLGDEFDVQWDYDKASGFLESIKAGPNLGSGTLYHTYLWDELGNLTGRTDENQSSLTESFTYDVLNRLETATLGSTQTLDVDYDAAGNITYKSDVGTYSYNDGPHSVSDITGTRAAEYDYDDNGNMDCRFDDGDCTNGDEITWYPFNKPKKISFGSDYSEFTYGSDRSRLKQYSKTGSTYTTTYYIGGIFEVVDDGSTTEYRHNIVANGKTVAIYTRPTTGAVRTEYVLRDHQQNVVELTDYQGTSVQSYSFDAFGKRRNADWTADTSDNRFLDSHETERGYTGHEHLDNVQLIHMNGRVQDPIIGRMISADPFVPDLLNGQAYNRYSYVFNSPLSLIDPTGFDPWDDPFYIILDDDGIDPLDRDEWCFVFGCRYDGRLDGMEGYIAELDQQELDNECSQGIPNPTCRNAGQHNYYNDGFSQTDGEQDHRSIFDTARQYANSAMISIDNAFGGFVPDIVLDLADPITPVANIAESISDGEYLEAGALASLAAVRVKGKYVDQVKEFFGFGNPTKLNRGGVLQPYDATTGRFLPYSANPGLRGSPAARISSGFSQGLAQGYSGVQGVVPVGRAESIAFGIGDALGKLGSFFGL